MDNYQSSHEKKRRFIVLMSFFALSALCSGQEILSYNQSAEGVDVTLASGTLSILPMEDNAIRIRFFKDIQPKDTELIFIRT
jgi:alpha-D-xyloside xylohydrolase